MLQQFTHAELESFNRTQLWQLCRERGLKCYPKSVDCVEAIWNKQQSVEKVAVASVKEDSHFKAQAQVVAPEITSIEISFYEHEVYAQDKQIASITYDMEDFATSRWVVVVGETEIHHAETWAKCFEYVRWHYKQGTLPAPLVITAESTVLGGEIPISFENLLDKPFDELTVDEWEQVKQHSADLRRQLEQAYTSDNFGCYNRVGGRVKGNELIQKERRRVASGELVMVCCDIAGLGKRNSEIGEVAVNEAVRSSLNQVRTWRGIFFISQLNSGDEFVFIVDRADAIAIIPRMNNLFKSAGFEGIYGAVEPLSEDYISSANDGMNLVYQMKQFAKVI